ncbi:MAG: isochorismatase family protein [Syntrophobacter sp.]
MDNKLVNLNHRDCILFLVDIQNVILENCIQPERIPANASALIEIARIFGIPVLFSVQNKDKLGGVLPELTEIVPRPRILDKLEFDSLENPAVAETIRQTGRKTILLAGIETHICIFHTGIGALRLGYGVHVAADCVTSRGRLNHETGLRRLDRAGAVISSTDMIIFELLHRAGTEEFRASLPLLKRLQSMDE